MPNTYLSGPFTLMRERKNSMPDLHTVLEYRDVFDLATRLLRDDVFGHLTTTLVVLDCEGTTCEMYWFDVRHKADHSGNWRMSLYVHPTIMEYFYRRYFNHDVLAKYLANYHLEAEMPVSR